MDKGNCLVMVVNLNFEEASKRAILCSFHCLNGILNEGLENGSSVGIISNKKRLSVPV